MSEFVDESGISSKLKSAISKAQFDPEPTPQEFLFGPVKTNLRRNVQVQEQQIPVSQKADKWTIEGQKAEQQEKKADELEKLYIKLAKRERKNPGALAQFLQYLPNSQQINLYQALKNGNVKDAYLAVRNLAAAERGKETAAIRKEKRKLDLEKSISKMSKAKSEKEKKKKKKKDAQQVGPKGQKVVKKK